MTREHCDLCDLVIKEAEIKTGDLITTDYRTPNLGPINVRLTFSCGTIKPMRLCTLCRKIVMSRVKLT